MIEYPKDDRNSFYVVFIDFESFYGVSKEKLLWHLLPDHVKHVATRWGLSDTSFRDSGWVYYRDLIKDLK